MNSKSFDSEIIKTFATQRSFERRRTLEGAEIYI